MQDYPIFSPPQHLADKDRKDWTAAEAAEYREWLLETMDGRVSQLLDTVTVPIEGNASADLLRVGETAAALLKNAPFSVCDNSRRRLTDRGRSLAADLGLLVASYLLAESPERIRWETLTKPKKELSYNLPVLRGFSFNYLDPIGGSIAEASAVLRGDRDSTVWSEMYEYWLKQIR